MGLLRAVSPKDHLVALCQILAPRKSGLITDANPENCNVQHSRLSCTTCKARHKSAQALPLSLALRSR